MKLTPIKVKGKSGQKTAWTAPKLQHSPKRERSDGEGAPRRRRPKTKRPAALIEQLPTEILERITTMSRNLNFPRSSLRIGYILSDKSFLTELLVAAFGPTWDLWFGCLVGSIHSYCNFLDDYQRVGGDPAFQVCKPRYGSSTAPKTSCDTDIGPPQSAVLACPWMNLEFLLEAQQKWYRRTGTPRLFEHIDPWASSEGRTPGNSDHPPRQAHLSKDAAACFEADWELLQNTISGFFSRKAMSPDMFISTVYGSFWNGRDYVDLHPQARIPDRLLSSPASWGDARWLFWLVRGGAQLLPDHTWEVRRRAAE